MLERPRVTWPSFMHMLRVVLQQTPASMNPYCLNLNVLLYLQGVIQTVVGSSRRELEKE